MTTFTAAIAGCGTVFPAHKHALEALDIPITAVCDTDTAKLPKDYKPYTDYSAMLQDGGFDVLHICLPHYLHAPVALAAMARGVHVLCEKPMALTVPEAEAMRDAAEANRVQLGVVFQNRYNPGTVLLKNALESGRLGKVQSGWLRLTWNRDEAYYASAAWRGSWATEGGGVLINQAIHSFDLLSHLLGSPSYTEAAVANRAHPSIEVEDVAEGLIVYGEAPVSFYVCTNHPFDAPAELGLSCENGTAILTGSAAHIQYRNGFVETETDAPPTTGKPAWGNSHLRQIQAFYAALAHGKAPDIDACEGLKTQRLINGIYEAAKTGKRFYFS